MPCRNLVPHLNELHERFFSRGLVVVGVTDDEQDEITAYIKKNKVAYPVATANVAGDYQHEYIPSSVLIDTKGVVLWHGHPGQLAEAQIEAALENARPAKLAAGLEEVNTMVRAGKHGDAYQKARQLLEQGQLSTEARDQARQWLADRETEMTAAIEAANAALADGDVLKAFLAVEPVASDHDGVPKAEEAKAIATRLQSDAKTRREIDAGKQLLDIEKLSKQRDYDAAYKAFKKLASSASTTKAGRAAAAAALAIEKGGKLGYVRGCSACQSGDKTCDFHRKKKH